MEEVGSAEEYEGSVEDRTKQGREGGRRGGRTQKNLDQAAREAFTVERNTSPPCFRFVIQCGYEI
jgi:hypothetical protein